MIQKRFMEICLSKDFAGAVEFQNEIKELLPGKPYESRIETVCGLDISYNKFSLTIYAAAAVYSFPNLSAIENGTISSTANFPYIPGLLAFREGPAVLQLVKTLKSKIDLFILDGHGMAHPRGAGLASILGLLLNIPSIGCAKTKLVGQYKEPGQARGSVSSLRYRSSVIGKVLRSRSGVKPIFVSIGYKIDLDRAIEIILKSCVDTRIALPIRTAHHLANMARQRGGQDQ